MTTPRPSFVAWVALAALACVANVARADPPELDRRLDAAGIDDALRAKVHGAIDRAVTFLAKRQQADGSFLEGDKGDDVAYPRCEVTALCALALRHAGTPAAMAAASRSEAWLFGPDSDALRAMEVRVEAAGLALALLASTPGHEDAAKRLAKALVAAQEPKEAWWDYHGPGSDPPPERLETWARREHRYPNLMASHLAILGLLAASRMAVEVPTAVWVRHGLSLVEAQTPFDSWDVHRGPPMQPLPSFAKESTDGWVIGTLLGLSDLVACARVVEAAKDAPASARGKIARAIDRGRKALLRDAGRTLVEPLLHIGMDPTPPAGTIVARASRGSDRPGSGPCYRLACLAKACTFADVAAVDGFAPPETDANGRMTWKANGKKVPWYTAGVDLLLRFEKPGGGWAPSGDIRKPDPASESETAWGLLFFVHYAQAFHPRAPAPVDVNPPAPAMGG